MKHKILLYGLAVLIGGTVSYCLTQYQENMTPSSVVADIKDQSIAVQGGVFTLTGTLEKRKSCRVLLDQGLGRKNSDGVFDWWPIPSMPALPALRGEKLTFRIHLPVPASIPDGNYTYFGAAYDEHCAGIGVSPPRITRVPVPITTATTDTAAPVLSVPKGPLKLLPQQ